MPKKDARNSMLCMLIAAATFFSVGPVVEMPFNDDWSYAFTTREFIRTGQIHYNGWGAPLLLTHVLWGSLFIRLFGFSFTVLRFSTLPFAMGSAAMSYLLARTAGLRGGLAFFCSMLLVLCPFYLPLATSFMTDVPGVFFSLLAIYGMLRAIQTWSIGWLVLGVFVGLVGGFSRQIVWLAPLSILPYAAWLGRRNRRFLLTTVASWIVVLISSQIALKWESRQPYSIYERPLGQIFAEALRHPRPVFEPTVSYILTLALLTLPVLIAALPAAWDYLFGMGRFIARASIVFAIIFWGSLAHFWHRATIEPWLRNMIATNGLLSHYELPGAAPISQPMWVRHCFGIATVAACAMATALLITHVIHPSTSAKSLRRPIHPTEGRNPVLPMLVLFIICHSVVVISQAMHNWIYDRYLLPIIPCVAILVMLGVQSHEAKGGNSPWSMRIGIALLALFGAFAMACDQDLLALARARAEATKRLTDRGVPRTAIFASFEYDSWTQLEATGYINNELILLPKGIFREGVGFRPSIKPRFAVARTRSTGGPTVDEIEFTSWLPPFHRRIYVNEIVGR